MTPRRSTGSATYKYGFHDDEKPVFKVERGLNEDIIRQISAHKGEPEWMLEFRLKALEIFRKKPMPSWGADLSGIDFENIFYYLKPSEENAAHWDDVPEDIKNTFDRLGIPEAERKFLAGVGAQYESEVVYHNLQKDLEEQGRHLPATPTRRCASTRSCSASTGRR